MRQKLPSCEATLIAGGSHNNRASSTGFVQRCAKGGVIFATVAKDCKA